MYECVVSGILNALLEVGRILNVLLEVDRGLLEDSKDLFVIIILGLESSLYRD